MGDLFSWKKSEDVIRTLRKDLDDKQKELKVKEKAMIQLEKKCENFTINNKNFKTELTKVKNENKKLLKSKANSKKPYESDSNQNLTVLASSSRSKSSLLTPLEAATGSPNECTATASDRLEVDMSASPLAPSTSPAGTPPLQDLSIQSPRTPPGCKADHLISVNENMIANYFNKPQSSSSPQLSQLTAQCTTSQPVQPSNTRTLKISADYMKCMNSVKY